MNLRKQTLPTANRNVPPQIVVVDFGREGSSDAIFQRPPLLTSHSFGWEGVCLEHHVQDGIETDEITIPTHLIALKLNSTLYGERWIDGKFSKELLHFGFDSLLPANHRQRCVTKQAGEFITIALDPAFVSRAALTTFNQQKVELTPHFATKVDPLILGIGQAFLTELEQGCPAGNLYVETLASTLAAHLVKSYSSEKPQVRECRGGMPKYKLRRVLEFINDNLAEDLSLDEIADAVEMSSYYFTRMFKQTVGLAPHQYVIRQRVERAKVLLTTTDLTIAGIAAEVGFYDQSHLARHFKRRYGVAPKEFLRK